MKIFVLTSFYNGDLMIPYFLSHYSYANEIIVAFNDGGKDIDRPTRDAILRHPNTVIRPFKYPAGKTDYVFAIEETNRIVSRLKCDWVIVVSADELIFPIGMQDTRKVLREANGDVIYAWLWWVFRHKMDKDLDPSMTAILQRRHGYADRTFCGCIKPVIVRPVSGVGFSVGGHGCSASALQISTTRFDGAHWLNADITIALQRRMRGRWEMISKRSLKDGMGSQHFRITEKEIRTECAKFFDAPQLF